MEMSSSLSCKKEEEASVTNKGVLLTGANNNGKGDKFERFEQWLRENGAQFEMVCR